MFYYIFQQCDRFGGSGSSERQLYDDLLILSLGRILSIHPFC